MVALAVDPVSAAATDTRRLTSAGVPVQDGAWSYLGDPRVIARGNTVFAGWVSTRGEIVVHQYDRATERAIHRGVHRNAEVDDHDNPSLVFWRDRLWAFYSPHSGHRYPLNRRSAMRYRSTRRSYEISGGFGPEREVRTNTRGGLGFTYPNPLVAGNKLWLFWRGGDWNPTVSYTRDGVRWVKARTLVRGPAGQRPYAKYEDGPDGSIHVLLSDAHPKNRRTSLYYMRYKGGRFHRADGSRIGTMRDLPLRVRQLDLVYRFDDAVGRGWPHDVALDGGTPVVLYTARMNGPDGHDTFYYGRWTGTAWSRVPIAAAGPRTHTFNNGGATFDHVNPSRFVLSRRIDYWFQVELWRTPDHGLSWLTPFRVTSDQDAHSFRPVIPRGLQGDGEILVYYVHGTATSFRSFQTEISMAEIAPANSTVSAWHR